MATKEELIQKYEEQLVWIINPDGMTEWDEIGFNEAPEGYETVYDWLKINGEFDEGQQTEISCIQEFLEDLKSLEMS